MRFPASFRRQSGCSFGPFSRPFSPGRPPTVPRNAGDGRPVGQTQTGKEGAAQAGQRPLPANCKEGRAGEKRRRARTEMAAGAGGNTAERDGRSAVPQAGRRAKRPLIRITHRSLSWSPSPYYMRYALIASASLPPPSRRHRLHHDAATRGGGTPAFSVIPSRLVSLRPQHSTGSQPGTHTAWARLGGFALARHRPNTRQASDQSTYVRAPPGRQMRCDVTTGFVLAPLTRCTVTCSAS